MSKNKPNAKLRVADVENIPGPAFNQVKLMINDENGTPVVCAILQIKGGYEIEKKFENAVSMMLNTNKISINLK